MADTEMTAEQRRAKRAAAGETKAKRRSPTEGWTKEGEVFSKAFTAESPEAAMKLARKVLSKAQKQKATITIGFEASGITLGLPADGKKMSASVRGIARSLDNPKSEKTAASSEDAA